MPIKVYAWEPGNKMPRCSALSSTKDRSDRAPCRVQFWKCCLDGKTSVYWWCHDQWDHSLHEEHKGQERWHQQQKALILWWHNQQGHDWLLRQILPHLITAESQWRDQPRMDGEQSYEQSRAVGRTTRTQLQGWLWWQLYGSTLHGWWRMCTSIRDVTGKIAGCYFLRLSLTTKWSFQLTFSMWKWS